MQFTCLGSPIHPPSHPDILSLVTFSFLINSFFLISFTGFCNTDHIKDNIVKPARGAGKGEEEKAQPRLLSTPHRRNQRQKWLADKEAELENRTSSVAKLLLEALTHYNHFEAGPSLHEGWNSLCLLTCTFQNST